MAQFEISIEAVSIKPVCKLLNYQINKRKLTALLLRRRNQSQKKEEWKMTF